MANEEEVGNEHVEEVLGEMILQTQRGGIQYMVALRDDEGDTMQGVHERMRMGEKIPTGYVGFYKSWMELIRMQH